MTPTADSLQGFRNRVINGSMVIDQRNAGASSTIAATRTYYLDRWNSVELTDGAATIQQVTDAPSGFNNSLKVTVTSADTSLGATQFIDVQTRIEGFNIADLGWGTASAKPVTLSFWVRSSLTGTFGGSFTNDSDRSYPFTYTISSADTWEQKSVTVVGDTTGTWATNNAKGILVTFGLGVGSTYSGTAGAWAGSFLLSATGATSVIGTNGATFYITGVQLEAGSVATPFERRPFGAELALCQRYAIRYLGTGSFEKLPVILFPTNTTNAIGVFCLPVTMRASPSISQSSIAIGNTGGSQAVTSVAAEQQSRLSPAFTFTVASGLTASAVCLLQANNSTSAFVILSAEL
jgi:hypothetical protein